MQYRSISLAVGLDPVIVAHLSRDGGPMLVDGSEQRLLGGGDDVVDLIARRRRAGIVVESPRHPDGTVEMAGEVNDIVIFKRAYLLGRSRRGILAEMMGIAAGLVAEIAGHIA